MSFPTEEDKIQITNGIRNLTYYGKETKNTIIHIVSYENDDYISNNSKMLYDKFSKLMDDHPNVINFQDKLGLTPLMISIINNKILLIDILLKLIKEKNISINFELINMYGNNTMQCACKNSNQDLIISLMELGAPFNILDISKISDEILRENISRVFFDNKKIEYESTEDIDYSFKIYTMSYFKIKNKIGSGTFGDAIDAIEISTGRKCILKKFRVNKDAKSKIKINSDIIKDIMFLKSLNRRNNAVKIYGILIDNDDNFYLVIEKLIDTLNEIIYAIYKIKDDNNRHRQLLQLFKECLICIDNNSKAGIVHGDVKSNNMMVDPKNLVKFIDYGWSSYLGVSPYVDIVNHTIHEGIYISNDGDKNETKLITYYLDGVNYSFARGFYGYNHDVVSIGLMFIQVLMGYDSYISHNGILYSHENDKGKNYKYYTENVDKNDKILSIVGRKIYDLIIDSIEVNPNIRKSAKKLLNSSHFDSIEIIDINKKVTDVDDGTDVNFNKYNTIFQSNYKKLGYEYFEDICRHYSNFKIELCSNKLVTSEIRKRCYDFYIETKSSLDVYLNSVIFVNKCVNDGKTYFSTNFENKFMMLFMMTVRFYSYFYLGEFVSNTPSQEDLFILSKLNDRELMNSTYFVIRNYKHFYDICPIMTYVGYIKFLLQISSTDKELIYNNCQYILKTLNEILTSKGTEVYNPIELIGQIHDSNPEKISI